MRRRERGVADHDRDARDEKPRAEFLARDGAVVHDRDAASEDLLARRRARGGFVQQLLELLGVDAHQRVERVVVVVVVRHRVAPADALGVLI